MKNIMKLFALMVVATVALSCVNEPEELVGGKKVNISLTTEQTKVYVSNASDDTADAYHFALDGDEKVAISYNEGALQMVQLDGDTTATFEVEDDNSGAHKFLVMTEWQKSLNGNGVSAYTNGLARVTVPYVQTIRSDRKDEIGLMPNRFGQVLYGVTEEYESLPENISLTLKHATAYGKVDIKNFALAEGEILQQVQIVADKAISGTFDFNPETAEWSVNENDGATKNRYVINVKTSSLEDVWFSCRPNEALEEVTIHLQTNKCIYKKTLSFAGRTPLQFKAGEISRFTVDMTNAFSQIVTEDAASFNPDPNDKYFIVISSETGVDAYPSGDFVVRNNTCTINPRAYYFPTIAQMGVNNFLWRIIKNDDGTFSFLSLDPTAVDGEGNFNEYLWQCNGQAQGFCVQVDGKNGGKYKEGEYEYVNTFRLFDNTDEKYPDSFYMTSTNNIDADGNGTRWTMPYFYNVVATNGAPSRYVSMRCGTGADTNKYRVRFLKYEEGKSTWDAQWALPGGDDEAAYMIIFDYWYGSNATMGALTHSAVGNYMAMDKFATDSANGLISYTRPAEVGPFSQGTLEVAEDFDYTDYTWYIKRDTSNPGTYFIYYKEDGKNKYLTQQDNGTNMGVDKKNSSTKTFTKNFKLVSFIYDNQEVLGLVVDKPDGTGFRYAGYYWDTDVRSISAQRSCYSNIYLHKIPTASAE